MALHFSYIWQNINYKMFVCCRFFFSFSKTFAIYWTLVVQINWGAAFIYQVAMKKDTHWSTLNWINCLAQTFLFGRLKKRDAVWMPNSSINTLSAVCVCVCVHGNAWGNWFSANQITTLYYIFEFLMRGFKISRCFYPINLAVWCGDWSEVDASMPFNFLI